jgi:hypothetical protein
MKELKTERVEITYSDGSSRHLQGHEAEKWAEGCKSTGVMAMIHGCPFPELEWIEEGPPEDTGKINETALNEDLDPYLGDGPTGAYFSDERALIRLLTDDILFANSRKYLDLDQFGGKENSETIVLFVICNDVFYWGVCRL